jgi:hypothetical protein
MQQEQSKVVDIQNKWRWLIGMAVIILGLLGGLLGLLAHWAQRDEGGLMHEQIGAAYTPKNVVGNLGGMPVTIKPHIPNFIEYEGDPGWGERRRGKPPPRTHASLLNGFQVSVRYPDMATTSSPELRADLDQNSIKWLVLHVQSGTRWPGNGFLDRLYKRTIQNPEQRHISRQYTPLKSTIQGLELYAPRGINPQTGIGYRYDIGGDYFFGRKKLAKSALPSTVFSRTKRKPMACAHKSGAWKIMGSRYSFG